MIDEIHLQLCDNVYTPSFYFRLSQSQGQADWTKSLLFGHPAPFCY